MLRFHDGWVSTVGLTVEIKLYFREEFENAALIISTIRSIVHTNPSQKQCFSKTLYTLEEFDNAGLAC